MPLIIKFSLQKFKNPPPKIQKKNQESGFFRDETIKIIIKLEK